MDKFFKYIIKGVVQGVGFRPYIYRKAKSNSLKGYVKNIGSGVEVVVNDANFIQKLSDLPVLAKITSHSREEFAIPNANHVPGDFLILKSTAAEGETELPPDIFMCNDCLHDLRDSGNRRHNYYFVTCTNCGPRFSIIDNYPYDRPFTSMNNFTMCGKCKSEYENPMDRRYHAQTIACNDCGPKLKLLSGAKNISENSDRATISKAASLLKSGEVVAIKGVGGFHLCSLGSDEHVEKVRKILNRPDKPFAVLAKDVEQARKFAFVSNEEAELLRGPERPIVVLRKKFPDGQEANKKYAFKSASELNSIGVMLPYTSLHYMLFDFIDEPLVMTSCNIPGEPVATTEKLADYYLTHERPIINRCDDSVMKIINGNPFFLRRSRGFVPLPVKFPINAKDTLSLGAELNNVIAASKNGKCFLSQYIGETSKFETFNFMSQAAETLIKLTRLKPQIIACDLHPQYNSTSLAKAFAEKYGARLAQIQHHKAHVASVAAEHGLHDYIGIAMDGLGYGDDGKVRGGEIFDVSNDSHFERLGHLEEQPMIGGDSAAIYPKKMLFGILSKFMEKDELIAMNLFPKEESLLFMKLLDEKETLMHTTSTGRVLDATAALLGFCDHRTYDGRPAMLLESYAASLDEKHINEVHSLFDSGNLEPLIYHDEGKLILSTTQLIKSISDIAAKSNIKENPSRKSLLAHIAHIYLARGMLQIAQILAKHGRKKIVFSGGVAYNNIISSYMLKNGVLMNKSIPPGDGGICYGQAYLANLM